MWEGIRRTHGAPPAQATPLMPPTCSTSSTPARPPAPGAPAADHPNPTWPAPGTGPCCWSGSSPPCDAANSPPYPGPRRRAPRRVGHHPAPVQDQPHRGAHRTGRPAPRRQPRPLPGHRPAPWPQLAGITQGPVLRPVARTTRPCPRRFTPNPSTPSSKQAIARAGLDPTPYSAHSLRAGFVTYAHLRGATDRAIAHQTRHRSLATVGTYVRIPQAWTDNAATTLGL